MSLKNLFRGVQSIFDDKDTVAQKKLVQKDIAIVALKKEKATIVEEKNNEIHLLTQKINSILKENKQHQTDKNDMRKKIAQMTELLLIEKENTRKSEYEKDWYMNRIDNIEELYGIGPGIKEHINEHIYEQKIELKAGDEIDARDNKGKWYSAKIIEMEYGEVPIVHFTGAPSGRNVSISRGIMRNCIAQRGRYTN